MDLICGSENVVQSLKEFKTKLIHFFELGQLPKQTAETLQALEVLKRSKVLSCILGRKVNIKKSLSKDPHFQSQERDRLIAGYSGSFEVTNLMREKCSETQSVCSIHDPYNCSCVTYSAIGGTVRTYISTNTDKLAPTYTVDNGKQVVQKF